MLWVGTCVTPDYRPHDVNVFQESLKTLTGVRTFHLVVTPERQAALVNMDPKYVCLQDGQFIDWLPWDNNNLVMLLDADAVVQRDLTEQERDRFDLYDDNDVGMWWNAGPGDNLWNEYHRLQPNSMALLTEDMRTIPCYNGGLIVARPAVWEKIRRAYAEVWKHRTWFRRPQSSQWLLNLAIHTLHLFVDELGYGVHSHGHYPLTPDHSWKDGRLCYKDVPVFFRHKIKMNRHLP